MNSKTSLFSKALVKSDLRRFWWVSALYMIIMALFFLPNAIDKTDAVTRNIFNSDNGAFALVFGFVLGGLLFSYLMRTSSVSFMNSIPVSKTTQYLSHILSGFILLIIPIAITSGVILIEEILSPCGIEYCYKYFYLCVLYAACAFMVTAFASMLSGSVLAVYVFGVGFVCLPYFVYTMVNTICSDNVYGFTPYNGSMDNSIMQYVYIMGIDSMWAKRSVIYIFIALMLLIASWFLYRLRPMESYGEIVSFKILKPVFMYVVAVCFGVFGYTLLNSIHYGINFFIGVIPLGVVALVAAFMLNRKSFNLRGILKHIVIFAVLVGAVNIVFAFDLTGFERRLPNESDIVSIDGLDNSAYPELDMTELTPKSVDYDAVTHKGRVTDRSSIGVILNYHQNLINRGNKTDENYRSKMFQITYNLKNGKHMNRTYYVEPGELKPVYALDEFKKCMYPIVNDNEKTMLYMDMYDMTTRESSNKRYSSDAVDMNGLYEAIKKDVYALTPDEMADMEYGLYPVRQIDVFYTEHIDYNGKNYEYMSSLTIPLNSCFPNTVEFLKRQSINSAYIPADSINKLDVDYYMYDTARELYSKDWEETKNAQISDKKDIADIMTALQTIDYSDAADNSGRVYHLSIYSTDLKENRNDGYIQIYVPANEIPPALKKYFK